MAKLEMYDNMNHEEKREYGDFVRMTVYALKIARDHSTKVIVEFIYGHKNTPKKKKPLVKGYLLICDFPNIRVRDDGWTKRYRIDKIEHDTFRIRLENGYDIDSEDFQRVCEQMGREEKAVRELREGVEEGEEPEADNSNT